MNFDTIKKIHKKLSLMAFVQQGDAYVIDDRNVLKVEDDIKAYCQEIKDFMESGGGTDDRYPFAIETADALLEAYDAFKTALKTLRLPIDEVRLYQRKNTKGDHIKAYEQLKKQLTYAMVPLLHQRQRQYDRYDRGPKPLLSERVIALDDNKKTILNHNNPFSDITIENQSFIYPGDDGTYQTLQFHTGYTMSKAEDETSCAVVLQPDFKISKTEDRTIVKNNVTMDNTISTKLPDKQGEQELIYI